MLFNSLAYAVFLPCVFILYWVLPHRVRWPLLLAASYFFYMSWNPVYVVLIASTTLVSYFCALCLEKTESRKCKKLCLAGALAVYTAATLLSCRVSMDRFERIDL